MDFVEHDLRNLMEDMSEPFLLSEIKTLMIQLTAGVQFLHNNWILHVSLCLAD
jgi:cell division cycle 2-like